MAKIFRDYDRAALEMQYDGTKREPELVARRNAREEIVTRRAIEVCETRPRQLDLVYGIHPRERIDFFPTADRFAPLMVFIHGGYWKSRSKDMFSYLAPSFTDAGVNFAAIGYPLAPEARLTEIVTSCRRAIHWLMSYNSALRFDPSRVHVAGHSAGGHLAAMMMATDWTAHGLPAPVVKSATCISGLYDLEPLTLCRQHRDLNIDAAEVRRLSPVRLAPPRGGRLIATVGSGEAPEFIRNTEELAAAWKGRGVAVAVPEARGFYHFNILDEFIGRGRPLNRAVMTALKG